MTVSTTIRKATATGNNVALVFTANFYFISNSHITVTRKVISTGVETDVTSSVTITGARTGTCTVTFGVAPTTDHQIIIVRTVPRTQLDDYKRAQAFNPEITEDAFDKLVMITQELEEELSRAPKTAITSSATITYPSVADDKVLFWDGTSGALGNSTKTITQIESAVDAVTALSAGSSVLVSANDTTSGFLNGKLVAGTAITFTENNDGANETLTLAVNTSALGDLAVLDTVDTAQIEDDAVTAAKLADTAVTPGSYTNASITVDQQGRLTAASSGTAVAGSLLNIQFFTSSGTYNRTSGATKAYVICTGGGGGGGGSSSSTGEDGSGGGAGGTALKWITTGLGATETVTIGAGGSGTSGGAGNTGGTSSFGAHCSATGGTGGTDGALPASNIGGAGGTGSGGNLNITGGGGGYNGGGNSYFGGGGRADGDGSGQAGYANTGGGGSGAGKNSSTNTGGAGGTGVVVVYEYS